MKNIDPERLGEAIIKTAKRKKNTVEEEMKWMVRDYGREIGCDFPDFIQFNYPLEDYTDPEEVGRVTMMLLDKLTDIKDNMMSQDRT